MYNPQMSAQPGMMMGQSNLQQNRMQQMPGQGQQPTLGKGNKNQQGPGNMGMMQPMMQSMMQMPNGMMMPMMMIPGPNGTFTAQPFQGLQPNMQMGDMTDGKNKGKRKFKERQDSDKKQKNDEIPSFQKPLLPSGEPDPRVETWPNSFVGKSALAALNEFCAKSKCGAPDFKEEANKSTKAFKVTVHLAGMDWGWGESRAKGVAKHLAANETLKMLIQEYDGDACIIPGIDKVEKPVEAESGYDGSEDVIEDVEGGPSNFNFGPVCNWAKWSMYLNMYCQFQKFKNPKYEISTTIDPDTKKATSQCTGTFEYNDETGQTQIVEGSEVAHGKREAQHKLAAKFLAIALPECTGYVDVFAKVDEIKAERKAARQAAERKKREEMKLLKQQQKKEEQEAAASSEQTPAAEEKKETAAPEKADEEEKSDYDKMNVQELKAACKAQGLSAVGGRSALIKRLKEEAWESLRIETLDMKEALKQLCSGCPPK